MNPRRKSLTDLEKLRSESQIIQDNPVNGGLLLLQPDGVAVKCFPSKGKFLSKLRQVLHTTKADKQMQSARALQSIGINTPPPQGVFTFPPITFEAAYLYTYKEDVKDLRDILSSAPSHTLLAKLATDLALMARHHILFVDFHFCNVLVDSAGELWWIDPEIKESKRFVKKRFWSRIQRVKLKTDQGVLSKEHWDFFEKELLKKIPDWLV